ncbi:MAG: trypsin-like peptidase domain-containing protein [Spirochaetes bacterium]|nr:trypsin-like peptidase domain-containing protein [Spirochaetota bacterium]
MRLYSRTQIVLAAACSSAIALGVGFGLSALQSRLAVRLPRGNPVSGDLRAPTDREAPPVVATDSIQPYLPGEQENISVYERYNEGVVNITTEVVSLNFFYEPVPREGGSGSGSIIDAKGYVLTNNHVVKGAYKVFVSLADGGRYEGKVVGVDPENDLAVLKFDPPKDRPVVTIPFGSSASIKVGQKVLAIGNPFGLERTITEGIVSGLGRPVQQDANSVIRGMIQTDASINPGNSGGPLLDSRGDMIGITTMIYSPSGGSVGIGFAVPIDTAKRVVPELIKYGGVKRGWIDATYVELFPSLIEYMKQNGTPLPVEKGLLVSQARKLGSADKAGIRGGATPVRYYRDVFYIGGDVIVSVDGMKVSGLADLYSALEDNKPGEQVEVQFYRNGKLMKATVSLSDRADRKAAE